MEMYLQYHAVITRKQLQPYTWVHRVSQESGYLLQTPFCSQLGLRVPFHCHVRLTKRTMQPHDENVL